MSEGLGLSIGVDNLVAARTGGVPVSRRSVLTLFHQRASEVGLPQQNPNLSEAGLVVRGFVERVGDRAPLVAADGRRYIGAALTVEALDAMARTVGYGTPIAIAIPAYWSDAQIAALRGALLAQPRLAPNGAPPLLISDARAVATALYAKPGFPTNGLVALCDFGASGTSVSLFTIGSGFQQLGQSARHAGFSGNGIDQLVADLLEARARDASTASITDAARAESSGPLTHDYRRVKEQLSAVPVTTVPMGLDLDIRLSRKDFEQLIAPPLNRFIAWVEETLQRNRIPKANLAAVATVGGGASIPYLVTRLGERLHVPVFTTPQPAFTAAVGAAMFAQKQSSAGAHRARGPAAMTPTEALGSPPTMASSPPTMAGSPPTMAGSPPTSASAPPTRASSPPPRAGAPPTRVSAPPTRAGTPLTETAPTESDPQGGNDARSGFLGALAWSEAASGVEPVAYSGPEHTGEHVEETADDDDDDDDDGDDEDGPAERGKLPWHKRTVLIVTVAGAVAAVLAAAGLWLSLAQKKTGPTETITPQTSLTTTATTPSSTTTSVPTTTEPPPPPPPTTTYYQPPPTRTYPPSSYPPTTNPPLTTTPSGKTSKPQKTSSPSVTPSTTKNPFPFLPPFGPPPTKH